MINRRSISLIFKINRINFRIRVTALVMMSQVVVSQGFRLTQHVSYATLASRVLVPLLIRGQLWAERFSLPVEDSIFWNQLAHEPFGQTISFFHRLCVTTSGICVLVHIFHHINGCLYPLTAYKKGRNRNGLMLAVAASEGNYWHSSAYVERCSVMLWMALPHPSTCMASHLA